MSDKADQMNMKGEVARNDSGRWTGIHSMILFLGTSIFFVEGMDIQVFGLALPDLVAAWHLSADKFSVAASAGLLGFAIGAALGGRLGDQYGRRPLIICSVLTFGSMTMISASADDLVMLSGYRFIIGLGLGGTIPNGTALVAEFMPTRHRSVAIAICMAAFGLGGATSGLLASWILVEYGWSIWFALSGAMGVALAGLLYATLPESPAILEGKASTVSVGGGKIGESGKSLLFGMGEPRRDAVLLCAATLLLYVGWYAMFTWSSAVLTQQGFSLAEASRLLAIFAMGAVIGNLVCGYLVKHAGTRRSFTISAVFAIVALMGAGFVYQDVHTAFAVFAVFYAVAGAGFSGFQTISYALGAHIFPMSVRSRGIGAVVAAGRIGAILSAFGGIYLYQIGGGSSFFAGTALFVGLALVSALLIIDQTQPIGPLENK